MKAEVQVEDCWCLEASSRHRGVDGGGDVPQLDCHLGHGGGGGGCDGEKKMDWSWWSLEGLESRKLILGGGVVHWMRNRAVRLEGNYRRANVCIRLFQYGYGR